MKMMWLGKKRPDWDFSWDKFGMQHQIWNLSRNMEGEWGQQSLRHVESPGRTQFHKKAGCEHGCVEGGWWAKTPVRGMLAAQEGSRGRGVMWESGALQPRVSSACRDARDGRERLLCWVGGTGCTWETLACKNYIFPWADGCAGY